MGLTTRPPPTSYTGNQLPAAAGPSQDRPKGHYGPPDGSTTPSGHVAGSFLWGFSEWPQ